MGCNIGKEQDATSNSNQFSPLSNQANASILSNQNKVKFISENENINVNNKDQIFPNKAAKYRTKIDSRVTAKYNIKALIGKGSFSDVLRIESKTTKEPFAVKILKITNDQEKELLDSELSVLKNLTEHPNIIKLQEVIISKGTTYLVMELATGGELYDKIKSRGYLDEKYSCNITQMLLDGLTYMHNIGITHRDLKPENLLFYHPGSGSRILITDFGFSKFNPDPSNTNPFSTWCGTPEYIAPELLSKTPYDSKVDLWAIGVVVFVMLSGHLPFSANTTPRLFKQILTGQYSYARDVWNKVSPLAKNFIDNLITVDPKKRLDSLSALNHKWLKSFPPIHPLVTHKLLKNKPQIRSSHIKSNDHVVDIPMQRIPNLKSNSESASSSDSGNPYLMSNGLVLPFAGDFRTKVISKDKILEDNGSTMSPSNIDSMLATEDTDSVVSNLNIANPNLQASNYTFDNSIQLPVCLRNNKSSKSFSVKEQKLNFHKQFEIIAEESEDDDEDVNKKSLDLTKLERLCAKSYTADSVISSGSMKSAHIPIECSNVRSSYIEKVGVWLNEQEQKEANVVGQYHVPDVQIDSKNNFISQQSNSMKSNYTSLTTSDQSHTSSFNRFLLPTQSQKRNNKTSSSNKSIDHIIRNISLKKETWTNSVSGYETDLYPSNSYTSSTAPLQQFSFDTKNKNPIL